MVEQVAGAEPYSFSNQRTFPMKLSDVLLIVGAGAHQPYGFPTGDQLRQDILNLERQYYQSDKKIIVRHPNLSSEMKKELLQYHYIGKIILSNDWIFENVPKNTSNWKEAYLTAELDRFIKIFRESQNPSIDSYLATLKNEKLDAEYKNHVFIGKAIIEGIIQFYLEEVVIGSKQDWIQHLFKTHFGNLVDVNKAEKSPLNVITFNYDTFFENCLKLYLKHNYEKNGELIKGEVVKIEHVYGSLFNKDSIKVIGEDRIAEKEILSEKFNEIFKKVKRVYFLGFGFDELNIDLLFSKVKTHVIDSLEFHSTNIGFNSFTIKSIKDRFEENINIHFYTQNLGNIDSLSLIRNHAPLLEEKILPKSGSYER